MRPTGHCRTQPSLHRPTGAADPTTVHARHPAAGERAQLSLPRPHRPSSSPSSVLPRPPPRSRLDPQAPRPPVGLTTMATSPRCPHLSALLADAPAARPALAQYAAIARWSVHRPQRAAPPAKRRKVRPPRAPPRAAAALTQPPARRSRRRRARRARSRSRARSRACTATSSAAGRTATPRRTSWTRATRSVRPPLRSSSLRAAAADS